MFKTRLGDNYKARWKRDVIIKVDLGELNSVRTGISNLMLMQTLDENNDVHISPA